MTNMYGENYAAATYSVDQNYTAATYSVDQNCGIVADASTGRGLTKCVAH